MKMNWLALILVVCGLGQQIALAVDLQRVDLKFENVKEVSDPLFNRTAEGQIDSRSFGDKKFVCEKIEGREWVGESDASGYCSMQVQDRAMVIEQANQVKKIYLQSFGDNADYCEFEGQVVAQKGQIMIAQQSGLIYTDEQNQQQQNGVCELQVAMLEQRMLVAPTATGQNELICQRAICNGNARLKTVMSLKK